MEAFFVSLSLAAISALAFLAYRHPRAYERLYRKLAFFLTALALALAVLTHVATMPESYKIGFTAVSVIAMGLFAYLVFLHVYIAYLRSEDEAANNKHRGKDRQQD